MIDTLRSAGLWAFGLYIVSLLTGFDIWVRDNVQIAFELSTAIYYTLIVTHITIIGVTVYYHRSFTHGALKLRAPLEWFFRFWLWLTTGMPRKQWKWVHLKHHDNVDTKMDPHSPQPKQLGRVFFGGVALYKLAAAKSMCDMKLHRDDDWFDTFTEFQYGNYIGISLCLILDVWFFGVAKGLAVWFVQMLWIPFWAVAIVNGVGHYDQMKFFKWCYRNFNTLDHSANIVPLGIIVGGEELHNNHHKYPGSAKLSSKWWEFDIGWFWINVFRVFGLASNVKRPKIHRF